MEVIERYKLEGQEKWREWVSKIPAIKFDPEWEVKVIPPFGGAMARFVVLAGEKRVSIYLDCSDNLGCVGEPYWEVHPVDGDCARHLMADTDGLLKSIRQSIAEQ